MGGWGKNNTKSDGWGKNNTKSDGWGKNNTKSDVYAFVKTVYLQCETFHGVDILLQHFKLSTLKLYSNIT